MRILDTVPHNISYGGHKNMFNNQSVPYLMLIIFFLADHFLFSLNFMFLKYIIFVAIERNWMFFSVGLSLCLHIYLFFSRFSVHVFSVICKRIFKPLHFILQDLFLRYKGRGERSVEETAGLVGFKLPKQYQDPWDYRWKHTVVVFLIMSYTGTTSAHVKASVISCGLKESQEDLLIII